MLLANLDPLPVNARRARDFVSTALGGVSSEVCEVARLVISELATNAITHARTSFDVSVEVLDSCVRLGVSDKSGPAEPGPAGDEHAECGRGLAIVSVLAQSWGVDVAEAGVGKQVWAEIGR